MGAASTEDGGVTAAGAGATEATSFAVIDPSNPLPLESEERLIPLSAASMRARGETNFRSLLLAAAEGAPTMDFKNLTTIQNTSLVLGFIETSL